jgi:hypothetical protein
MTLNLTVRFSLILYFAGIIAFYFAEKGDWLWFAVGGGLALVNVLFAAMLVRVGMHSFKNKALFLGMLLAKSMLFILVVAMVLVFLKPRLLPFTLGVTVVIFGAIAAALYETRHLRKQSTAA